MDTFIQTTDFILFLCFSLMTVYLGVLAIAASLRNDTPYPQAGKRHRFAILVPPGSTSLPLPHYPGRVISSIHLWRSDRSYSRTEWKWFRWCSRPGRNHPDRTCLPGGNQQRFRCRHPSHSTPSHHRKPFDPQTILSGSERRNHSGPVRERGNPPGSVIGFIRCGHGIGLEMAEKESKEPQEQSGKKISPARYFRGISGKSESL